MQLAEQAGPLSWLDAELDAISDAGLRRVLRPIDSAPGPEVVLEGRRYLLLGSNNYLDLAGHPEVVEGAAEALRQYGAGSGASRLVSGATLLQDELETALAQLVQQEAALLFSSGYLANLATIAALVGRDDEVFSDALNHASLIDGCQLSGARVSVYAHGDVDALIAALGRSTARRKLIVTDAVFSMDGDAAPLADVVRVAEEHGAMLMLDESHSLGVLGATGGGLAEARGLGSRVQVVMGTLSKALGSAGGFIAGSATLVDFLRHRARGFVFDTAPSPASVGAALAAARIVRREPERRERVVSLTRRLAAGIAGAGAAVPTGEAAIVPLVIGSPEDAVAVADRARARGLLTFAIRPPSVPAGTSRLRLTVTAGHSEDQVNRAAAILRETVAGLDG